MLTARGVRGTAARTNRPAGAAADMRLFRVEWTALPLPPVDRAVDIVPVTTGGDVATAAATPPESCEYDAVTGDPRAAANAALALLQAWLAEPALADTRLAVVTGDHAALAARRGLGPGALGAVGAPGPVRAGRPRRRRPGPRCRPCSPAASRRCGARRRREVPRLARGSPAAPDASAVRSDPDGTVLITGGTGALGALSPGTWSPRTASGTWCWPAAAAPAAPELRAELTALGRRRVDRRRLRRRRPRRARRALLAGDPAEHPLTAVVHAAGVLDDGVARPR